MSKVLIFFCRLAVPRDTVSPVSNLEEDSRDDITEALIHEHAPGGSTDDGLHPSRSPSHITESTEQSVPITFDMSNRVAPSSLFFSILLFSTMGVKCLTLSLSLSLLMVLTFWSIS